MLTLYNTLTKKKEEFKPLHRGKVKMYVCGPTVYDYAHIGNLRAYLTADILRRVLEFSGFEVKMIKNITDVGHITSDADLGEDKIEAAAKKRKKDPFAISRFFTQKFLEDEAKINILKAHKYPRATAHIPQMIKTIETLIGKGFAYEKNGNVFFDITRFADYGKLSGNTLEKLKQGARIEPHPDKKNSFDFALWKKAEAGHIMRWSSPWSAGFPGWHIECSVMSMEYLGDTLDIHTGGEDNIFPHHEDEIAQSESLTGKPFSRFWTHTSWLLVDGKKMSKSEGNFYTLRDLSKLGYSPLAFRLLILQSHYKSHLNFTHSAMDAASAGLQKIYDFVETMLMAGGFEKGGALPEAIKKLVKSCKQKFIAALNNDLNTPQAAASIFEFIREINSLAPLRKNEALPIYKFMLKIDRVLGLKLKEVGKNRAGASSEIQDLAREREKARQAGDFQKADLLREKIEAQGYAIKDSPKGPEIKKTQNKN